MQLVMEQLRAPAAAAHACPRARAAMAPTCTFQRSQGLRAACRRQQAAASSSTASSSSRLVASAAAPAEAPSAQDTADKGWYACVANAEFMLHDVQNESFAEQLREKARFYSEKGKEIDFYLVSEPAWLDAMFPEEAKRVRRPCVALVSRERLWAKFMKLRLDRVLFLELGELPVEEATASKGPVPQFKGFDKWTAPYSPYAPGWWEAFMRK